MRVTIKDNVSDNPNDARDNPNKMCDDPNNVRDNPNDMSENPNNVRDSVHKRGSMNAAWGYFIVFVFLNRRTTNKGIGIEVIHFLNDGLWQMKQLEKWWEIYIKRNV